MSKAITVILISLFLFGCANNTTVRHASDWQDHRKNIKSIVIIPDDIKVVEITFGGDGDNLPEKEDIITNFVNEELSGLLQAKGFDAKIIDPTILENPDMAFAIEELDNSYTSIAEETYQAAFMTKEKASKMEHSLGELVAPIGALTEADAILLVDFDGAEKSSGMIAKDVAVSVITTLLTGSTPVANTERLTGHFALIDAKDGDLLWSNINTSPAINPQMVSKSLLSGLDFKAE